MSNDDKRSTSRPGASFFRTPPASAPNAPTPSAIKTPTPSAIKTPTPSATKTPTPSATKVGLAGQVASRTNPDPGSAAEQAGPLRVTAFNCSALAEVEPHSLGLTYEFRAASDGDPYSVTIAFEGRRMGVKHKPGTGDLFKVATTVERVLPGSGRVAVTTRVPNVKAGSWQVTARPSVHQIGPDRGSSRDARSVLPRLPGAAAKGSTGWAAVIAQKAPGVLLGSWAALVALGAAVALSIQGALAALLGLSVIGVGLVSLMASLIGLVGAKLYYLAVYPDARRRALYGGGMCIQGFVLGAAVGLIVGALVAGIDLGSLLDITAPALMFGMTIGRFGCFFSGCCVGRPTASRWGVWSSDRRLGVRRIPTQLMESALATIIGATALGVLVIAGFSEFPGTIFIGAMAAYVLGRQLLLPLRAESSKTRYGRMITLATAATVLLADVVVAITIYAR